MEPFSAMWYFSIVPGETGLSSMYLLSLSPPKLSKLELELIQSKMAQKQVLRGEVGCACVAHEVSVKLSIK